MFALMAVLRRFIDSNCFSTSFSPKSYFSFESNFLLESMVLRLLNGLPKLAKEDCYGLDSKVSSFFSDVAGISAYDLDLCGAGEAEVTLEWCNDF